MLESATAARIVLTTIESIVEARTLARTLVEEHLAACVNIIPQVQSIYRWQSAIEDSTESLLLIKTTEEKLPALEARLLTLHSYSTPEFLTLAVPECNSDYLSWLTSSLRQ
jgi:periplasmic divalent cation tolerance protein